MARREYSEKDNWLISLLRKAGGISQPSAPGRPNLPRVPTQKYRPVYSGSGRAGREAARDKALMDRYFAMGTEEHKPGVSIYTGAPGSAELGIDPARHRAMMNLRTNVGRPSDPALEEAMAPFKDLVHGKRLDRSRRRIEEEIPQGRWPQRNPNIPVDSYAEPMTEYEMEPMAPRLDPFYADEDFRGTEAEEKEAASMWNKAFEDHDRKMQAEGRMSIGPDTIEERMEAREPGPLENAIIQSLASKKRKKK